MVLPAVAPFLVAFDTTAYFADVLVPLLLITFGCGVLAPPVGFTRSRSGAAPGTELTASSSVRRSV
ncbi:hypothetical protein [Streptomyces puniciscabiei]|uniref:hypothetical protein n=1 Tax=Streptomyces puniciscabiei TaxID=164348 RepID=UPI0006EBD060|nr:hypothetical protein [Streptomyces puniciscabiei]